MEAHRSNMAGVLNEKQKRESSHRSNIKKSPSAKDDTVKKETKRKMEGNSTPRFILKKKPTLTGLRYRNHKQKEKAEDAETEHSPDSNSEMQDARKSMCLRCDKLRRKNNDSDHLFCSCSTQEGEGSTAYFEGSEGLQMTTCSDVTGQGDVYDLCVKCKQPGSLMYCDGKNCKRCYHLSCLDPPLSNVPFGSWLCFCCLRKKLEFGVHSVSHGIESILDSRNDEQKGKLYFVKFKGLAHIHNLWIPRSQVLTEDSVLLTKFAKKQQRGQEIRWKHEWTEPHRLLQRRFWMPPEQTDFCSCGHAENIEYCYVEWLIKWKGLGYEHSTWEFENSDFLCSANGKALVDEFERRQLEAKKTLNPSQTNKDIFVRENPLKKLPKFVDELPLEHDNEILISVCNIINLWHKNRNAILIHDQDAKVKSIVFISHLLSYTCLPFLIISTIPSLSRWEAEFAHMAPCINIVVYSGNRNVREIIRSLEFYEEGGCVMFKVLITSPDVVVEDLQYLNCLGWEGIIIDDCQKTGVSKYFEQFATLSSEFRLLILNSVPKETVADYYKMLSVLDIKGQSSPQNSKSDSSENGDDLSILKKRLKRYIVHAGKRTSSIFLEYWVPVQLSALQLKQYCNILTSNSLSLRSRYDYVEKLLDILKSIRMCCDHPYLADHSLQDSLVSGLTEKEWLNVGVNASSKFQLLDNILLKMKRLGLKVLILMQPESSKYHLGHILDDFLRERFGEASFAYVDKLIEKPKIESTLRKFNDAKSETFVMVIEKLACRPRIKLSSVDAVIIFHSDWNPVNDVKALKKITFCSKTQPVKLFRLYSPYTVEEKILSLAKDDRGIETDIENTSTKFRHSLLTWGASCLFDKLNELDSSTAHPESLIDKSLLKEMLYLLETPAGSDNNVVGRKCSNIVYAHMSGDSYIRNITLCGEKVKSALVQSDPVDFWSKLLQTITSPHTSGSSQRNRHPNPQIPEKDDDMRVSIPGLESVETQKESTGHTVQLHASSNNNQLNLGGDVMKEDATNPSYEVDKIYTERMGQILLKQEQETRDCKRQSNEEKQILKRYHDSVFQSAAAKEKILEELDQFDLHLKLQRKKLRIMQIEARNKEKQLKDQWLEKARSGIIIKPYESLPLTDTGFIYEYFNVKELLEEANDDESRYQANPSTANQNEVRMDTQRIRFERTLPQAEDPHPHNSPENEQPPVACSDVRQVPSVPNPSLETAQPNNHTTTSYQPEVSDFVRQLFAASQPIPQEELNVDPLQNVLSIMHHQKHSISHSHQQRKLVLAEEHEKELEEVRKKHSALVQNEEKMYKQQLKDIEELTHAVQKNLSLAELFRSNFLQDNTHGNLEVIQDQMEELRQELPDLRISEKPILPSPSNLAPVHPVHSLPPRMDLLPSLVVRSSQDQMEELRQELPDLRISQKPILPSPSNPAPVHPVHSLPPRMDLLPSLVVRSSQGQMGNWLPPMTDTSNTPVLPSPSSAAESFPFRPPSSVVRSPSVLSSASNSQTVSQNSLTYQDQVVLRPLTMQNASNVHFRAPAPHLRRCRPQ